jgi:beta-lactamase class A
MKTFLLFFLSLILWSSAMPQSIEQLKKSILNRIEPVDGNFGIAFKDLVSGETLFINEKENFHAASTMKTPVMIEVYKQAEQGKFSLQDSIEVKNEFKSIVDGSVFYMDISDDSGEKLYNFIGKKVTIYQLIYDMITVSSNLATNILIDIVDAKNVMKTMAEIGAEDIQVLRGVEDLKAFDKGFNNTTTAFDLMLILESIAEGKIVSEGACNEMIEILSDQKFRSKIPALLPPEVKVANKSGNITGVEHDSGIVYLPDGKKYILILLAKNLADDSEGIKAEAEISKLVYDFVNSK